MEALALQAAVKVTTSGYNLWQTAVALTVLLAFTWNFFRGLRKWLDSRMVKPEAITALKKQIDDNKKQNTLENDAITEAVKDIKEDAKTLSDRLDRHLDKGSA